MTDETPPKLQPRLKSAPKIRQFYWCDFPKDAQLPEFWKRRPVVILSKTATLHGAVTVIPCSTQTQQNPRFAFPLRTTIDGRAAWAICDKLTTVAVSRLLPTQGVIVRMPADEFHEMLKVVLDILPKLPAEKPQAD
jgi:mRNA interferase MazF